MRNSIIFFAFVLFIGVLIAFAQSYASGDSIEWRILFKNSAFSLSIALVAVALIVFLSSILSILNNLPSRKYKTRMLRFRDYHCPVCGYDMRASVERCPECGSPFDDIAGKLFSSLPKLTPLQKIRFLYTTPAFTIKTFTRYTDRARLTFTLANHAAHRANCLHIRREHLAAALLQTKGVGNQILVQSGFNPHFAIEKHPALSSNTSDSLTRLDIHPEVFALLDDAIFHSLAMGDDYVGTEHLALAFLNMMPTDITHLLGPTAPARNTAVAHLFFSRVACATSEGRHADALAIAGRLLSIDPASPYSLNQLAWLLATTADTQLRNPAEAFPLALKANELTSYSHYAIVNTLATCHAALQNFPEAIRLQSLALEKCPEEKKVQYQASLTLFQSHQPYLEPPAKKE